MTENTTDTEAKVEPHTLYLVPTPLGNLADITLRALAILRSVDCIACEDTRTSGKLLAHYGIQKPLLPYHEHNEKVQTGVIVEKVRSGAAVALITDAGTPNISDPGFRVVRACREAGLAVTTLPGACASVVALSASGLPTHQYFFAGFLPPKSAARCRFFETHQSADYSLVLYESKHRIVKCVEDIIATLGADRFVCIARELSKLHENYLIGTADEVCAKLSGVQTKGEFVVIIAPAGFAHNPCSSTS